MLLYLLVAEARCSSLVKTETGSQHESITKSTVKLETELRSQKKPYINAAVKPTVPVSSEATQTAVGSDNVLPPNSRVPSDNGKMEPSTEKDAVKIKLV